MTASRIFSEADQENFARWSGDWNPMHMDAVAARRTAAGAPVVHGVHLLLWALDEALEDERQLALPFGIVADFRKFVFVGQQVRLERSLDSRGHRIFRLLTEDGAVAAIRIRPCNDNLGRSVTSDHLIDVDQPHNPTMDEIRRASGWLKPAEGQGLGTAFPRLRECISDQNLAALAQISRLVGMLCPGLHSILARIDVDVGASDDRQPGIGFGTTKVDERYRLVRMEISGSGIGGSVEAFVRPEPIDSLSMTQAARLVAPTQFAERRALIVGGSRGLGAVTAKLLAAGGAGVMITYANGAAEASEICRETAASGAGSCTAMQLDVRYSSTELLADLPWQPTHIYYFATPRIFLQKKPAFDRQVFDRFVDFYVGGFNDLCTYFGGGNGGSISVFYPSSVAVTERPSGLTEYAMAKAAGELLCDDLMQLYPNLRIRVERLPRILTDQTATLQPVQSAPAGEIMLPLLSS
ncbi:MAG TPA: SDR family NAD(P)-dependent oxidoreductase [Tepidisphaeraceae bacterium]|nr:SDR family NAD(P)-dependent oxidoreductase [Tepidisphaeraceae bacterium]